MKIIISTHSRLIEAEVNLEDSLLSSSRVVAAGHHYALDHFSDQSLLVKGGKGELLTFYKYEGGELSDERAIGLDSRFKHVHQAMVSGDSIILTNTKFNELSVLDMNGDIRGQLHLGGLVEDINHVNSLFSLSESSFIALLHNHSRLTRSELVFFEITENQKIKTGRHLKLWHGGCHNITVDGDYLYYNASADGVFVVCDLTKGEIIKELHFPKLHTKGLSLTKDRILVGASESVAREQRKASKGEIVSIDRSTFEVVSRTDISVDGEQCGNINEIRVLSESDDALRLAGDISPNADRWRLSESSKFENLKFNLKGKARRLKDRYFR